MEKGTAVTIIIFHDGDDNNNGSRSLWPYTQNVPKMSERTGKLKQRVRDRNRKLLQLTLDNLLTPNYLVKNLITTFYIMLAVLIRSNKSEKSRERER